MYSTVGTIASVPLASGTGALAGKGGLTKRIQVQPSSYYITVIRFKYTKGYCLLTSLLCSTTVGSN